MLFRHAKSAWDTAAATDFERPLAARGHQGAKSIGRWVRDQGCLPDAIISSDAVRARQTLSIFLAEAEAESIPVQFEHAIYMADVSDLLDVLTAAPEVQRVMLVGHNPGMEDLVCHLNDAPGEWSARFKAMPTAALARLELPADWSTPPPGCGRLISFTTPKDVPEAG